MKKWMVLVLSCVLVNAWAAPVRVLEVDVNLAEWIGPRAGTNEFVMAMAAMGVSKGSIGVYVDENRIVPVAKLTVATPTLAAAFLSRTNETGLTVLSPTEFKWVPEKKGESPLGLAGLSEPHIRVVGDSILIGPESGIAMAAGLGEELAGNALARASVQLEPLIDPWLASVRAFIDREMEGFGKAISNGMIDSVEDALKSVASLPRLAVRIEAVDPEQRAMALTLSFADDQAAARATSFFNDVDDAWKDPRVTSRQLGLAGLVGTEFYNGLERDGADIKFNYAWPAREDLAMLKSVGEPLTSSLIDFSGAGDYPARPKGRIAAPRLGDATSFDPVQFEKDVRGALFFDQAWKTSVNFTIDWFDPPNAALVTASLSNVVVRAEDGSDLSKTERPGNFSISPSSGEGRISLGVVNSESTPATASFELYFEVPVEVELITLTKEQPLHETDEGGVCLIALSNSVVRLRSMNLSLRDASVYALNADEEYLAKPRASYSDSSWRGEFKGIPTTVLLAVPKRTETVVTRFTDLPVTEDAKLKMPSAPTNGVPTRYSSKLAKDFISPDLGALEAAGVTFTTNGGFRKTDVLLNVPMDERIKLSNRKWKTYLAGTEELVHQGRGGGWNGAGLKLESTNALNNASAIFGEVEVVTRSEVGVYAADLVSTNPVPLVPGSALPTVHAERNVVWVTWDKGGEILAVQAFEATGKMLKKANRSSSSSGKRGYYFWGIPARVVVTYSAAEASITLPFEFELKKGGLADVPVARKKAEAFEVWLDELLKIKKEAWSYGDLLAAHYFATNTKGEPIARVSKEVALSDPTSAKIFGYEVQPYKGYSLRLIPSDHDAERERTIHKNAWSGGSFEAPSFRGQLLAHPVKTTDPTVLLSWSDVYVKYADCSELKSVPTSQRDLQKEGWIKVR